jgi:hypothetical protein
MKEFYSIAVLELKRMRMVNMYLEVIALNKVLSNSYKKMV